MRQCGDCTLCCRLVPVNEGFTVDGVRYPTFVKPAGKRCKFQRHGKGCSVYAERPRACQLWSCRWLTNDDTANLSRPDRSHYVIDPVPDHIIVTDNKTGERNKMPVVQVWVDPRHPDAHRDPDLRAYLARRGEEGIAALIRYDSKRGFVLFPPAMTGEWVEKKDSVNFGDVWSPELKEVINAPG